MSGTSTGSVEHLAGKIFPARIGLKSQYSFKDPGYRAVCSITLPASSQATYRVVVDTRIKDGSNRTAIFWHALMRNVPDLSKTCSDSMAYPQVAVHTKTGCLPQFRSQPLRLGYVENSDVVTFGQDMNGQSETAKARLHVRLTVALEAN